MYALIETNGATHIAIHVQAERASESLMTLAAMLEHNATFIRSSWREQQVVDPVMTISLSSTYQTKDNDGEALLIAPSNEIIGSEFVIDSPAVYRSNAEYRKKTDDELNTKRREIDALKLQVEKLQAALNAATSQEQEEAA